VLILKQKRLSEGMERSAQRIARSSVMGEEKRGIGDAGDWSVHVDRE